MNTINASKNKLFAQNTGLRKKVVRLKGAIKVCLKEFDVNQNLRDLYLDKDRLELTLESAISYIKTLEEKQKEQSFRLAQIHKLAT